MENIFLSNEVDTPILLFLWKWKVATTATLSAKFLSSRSPQMAYQRLWRLERAGFIRSRIEPRGMKHLWTLDKKGYLAIRGLLPPLRSEGYQSEYLGHDLLVAAVHLGDWLLESPPNVKFMSEQQLRRYDFSAFPTWAPKEEHRPDGYWRIPTATGDKTIALEVELNEKKEADYELVGQRYEQNPIISQILWIVPRHSAAQRIHRAIETATRPAPPHSFTTLDQFFKLGWQSAIVEGQDTGKTISELLLNRSQTPPKPVWKQFLLNVRKSPHKSKASLLYAVGDFSE